MSDLVVTRDPSYTVLLELYRLMSALPVYLERLTEAVVAQRLEVPPTDLSTVEAALLQLLERQAEEATAPSQEPTNQQWDQMLEALREVANKVGKRQQIAAVSTGMDRDTFPLPEGQVTQLSPNPALIRRFDYDTRTDGNPVYIGEADPGTATGSNGWTIKKVTYDSSARATFIDLKYGTWDGRASGWGA